MSSLLIALIAASAVQAAPAVAPARTLQSIPGVTVKYYDVTGKDDAAVKKSIASQRPKTANGEPIPASTSWDLGASITKRTEGTVCTITGAKLSFKGLAELPRHVQPNTLKPEFQKIWNSYVAELEASAASSLGFVSDNLGEVEKALVGIPCDNASTAMEAATARLKEQQRAHGQAHAAQAAATAAAAEAAAADAAKAKEPAKRQ